MRSKCFQTVPCAGLAALLTLLAGCNAGTSSDVASTSKAALSVPVLITDAPANTVVSFSLTLNSITLTDSAGKTTSILSTPTTIEATHLNGVQEGLVTASIAADTYTAATFTFSSPQVTYINSSGALVSVSPTLASSSYTDTFASPITLSSTSTSLLIDLIASQSVTISGSTVTVSPVFSVRTLASTTLSPGNPYGGSMHQFGTVVSASGTTLVVEPPSGSNLTFATNSSTVFQGVSGLTSLTAGEMVEVDFTTQSNGTLLATRVQLEPASSSGQQGNQLSGPVTSVSSGSFKLTLTQGGGSSIGSANFGSTYTINTSASTTYGISQQFQSLSGLPFTPTFSASTLKAGQTVSVTASSVSGTTATASTVSLIPQTISGTVTASSTSGAFTVYTVTLTSGSTFATLSGASTITVYTSTSTTAGSSNSITTGNSYRFNGLVFATGSGFSMVAGVCPDGTPQS